MGPSVGRGACGPLRFLRIPDEGPLQERPRMTYLTDQSERDGPRPTGAVSAPGSGRFASDLFIMYRIKRRDA